MLTALEEAIIEGLLPYGPPDARTPIRLTWSWAGRPLVRIWALRLMLA